MKQLVEQMRALGVRRLAFNPDTAMPSIPTVGDEGPIGILEIELMDTIPAPPPFEPVTDDSEPAKPPGTCIALGCMEPGGWHFDRRYCGPHGRSAAGVKP